MSHLFFYLLKIGLFTIGGYAMIPLIQSGTCQWLADPAAVGGFYCSIRVYTRSVCHQYCYFCRYENLRRIGCVSNYDRCNSSIVCDHLLIAKFFSDFSPKSLCSSGTFRSASAVIGLIIAAAYSVAGNIFFNRQPSF